MSVFLWHVTFVYLIVLVLLSYIIYKNTQDKLFLYYFAYVFLLFTYIVCRNYYFMEMQTYPPVYLYSYYVQVVYLCVYFHFGIAVINFRTYYPNFTRWIYRYMLLALGIGNLIFLAGLLEWIPPSYMAGYYYKFFFPIHICIAIFIIYRAITLKQESLRIYFLIGTITYLVLGTVAVLSNFYQPPGMLIRPIGYFYIAIIIECTFFAIGLGIRVKHVYTDKLETERRLNVAQKDLQVQMQQQIEQQEKDNISLQREKELQVLATQVAQLENKVLRSQINSHFIFNVLNSIKAFIVEHDSEQAIRYLNKFSKLMRKILDGSRNEKSSLADELATVELYLNIEQMRIPEELTIYKNIDTRYKPDTVLFPALLMQPFVENAVWHGLIPSKGPKELTISVYDYVDGIRIEIMDNGIGYTTSLAEKSPLDTHRSHAMDIIRERIVQFNKRSDFPRIDFDIADCTPHQGTRVRINVKMDQPYSK